MKKLILTFLFIAIVLPASMAQFTKIGAAIGYNHAYYFNDEPFSDHKLKNPILSFNAVYEVNLPFHIVPRLNIYFPYIDKQTFDTFIYKTTMNGISLDVDGHYVFNSLDKFEFYGLAGINILYARRSYVEKENGTTLFSDASSNTALGLNLGAGAYWMVKDEFDLFFEAKVIVASQIQIVGTAGILLNMEYLWNKEKDSGY